MLGGRLGVVVGGELRSPEPLSVRSDQDILNGESVIGSERRDELVAKGLLATK